MNVTTGTSNGQQQITIQGAVDGFFNLIFGPLTTGNLPWNATAQQVEDALESLANVGVGNVVATVNDALNIVVEFIGGLAGQPIDQLGVDITGLIPSGVASVLTEIIDSGGNAIQDFSNALHQIIVSATGGTFTLSHSGGTTPALPFNATVQQIEAALEGLVGAGNVSTTPAPGGGGVVGVVNALIEFVGGLAGQVVDPILTDVSNLLPAGVGNIFMDIIDVGGTLISAVSSAITSGPLRIGAEVLLGDPVSGQQISRGFGSVLGRVVIMPHYSNAHTLAANISPTNRMAMVPANHTGDEGTVYFNLWNDGQLGLYDYQTKNSQAFLLILPLEQGQAIEPFITKAIR
jgi:hypothetical protein